LNQLFTSVTGHSLQAEIRAPEGHLLQSLGEQVTRAEDITSLLIDWVSSPKWDIGAVYITHPHHYIHRTKMNERDQVSRKYGSSVRFYQHPYDARALFAYAAAVETLALVPYAKSVFQIPTIALLIQELKSSSWMDEQAQFAWLWISRERFSLSLFQDDKLLNHAIFNFRTAEDILYFLLFSLLEFGIDVKKCPVILAGDGSREASIQKMLSGQCHLDHTFFQSPDDAFNFDLKLLRKCAS
jgi:hypothetical protein